MRRLRGFVRALGKDEIPFPSLPDIAEKLQHEFAIEADYGRPQLWLGFLLLLGAAAYFSLSVTPPATLLYPLAGLFILFALSLRKTPIAFALAFLGCAFLGGGIVADIKTRMLQSPRILQESDSLVVQGTVMEIGRSLGGRPRILLHVQNIEGMEPAQQPALLRLTGVNLRDMQIGDHARMQARLLPLPGPTQPGAYDPSFVAYFNGLGGIGTVAKKPDLFPPLDRSFSEKIPLGLANWRDDATKRIRDGLGGETGAVAASLITGDRAGLTDELYQAFNGSGLMHVLSISGLHMILVAGGMFFFVRLLLAGFGAVYTELPAKKIAALAAIGIVSVYELISGGAVATTRSYIMILIVFCALLLDRPALSMRNVVIAALTILLLMPSEIMGASFQMSFAATAALIAAHERKWFPKLRAWDDSLLAVALSWLSTVFIITVGTSLIAEIATLPFTLHHFHRISIFGIAGNVLALIFIQLAIMPGVLLTLLALPFGLESWTLPLLGFGVDGMIDVARFVAGFPAALTGISGFGAVSLLLCSFAIAWACLWRGRLAALAILPYLAGLAWGFYEKAPDLYISQSGWSVAVRGANERLSLLVSPRETFAAIRWMEADGDRRAFDESSVKQDQRCDPLGCTVINNEVGTVAIAYDSTAVLEDCERADVLILPRGSTPSQCARPKLIIDKNQIRKAQGISVTFAKTWRGDPDFALRSVAEECGTRPWCTPPMGFSAKNQ